MLLLFFSNICSADIDDFLPTSDRTTKRPKGCLAKSGFPNKYSKSSRAMEFQISDQSMRSVRCLHKWWFSKVSKSWFGNGDHLMWLIIRRGAWHHYVGCTTDWFIERTLRETQDSSSRRRMDKWFESPPNLERLVLGSIDAWDSESRRIFQEFSSSARFTYFWTARTSKIKQNSSKTFSNYFWFFKRFIVSTRLSAWSSERKKYRFLSRQRTETKFWACGRVS